MTPAWDPAGPLDPAGPADHDDTPDTAPLVAFQERLLAPWWWWPASLLLAVVVCAEISGGAPGLQTALPYLLLLPLTVAILLRVSRGRIRLGLDGVLHVPGARIDVGLLSGGTPYDPRSARSLLRGADPLAFTSIRPFVGTGVHLEVDDPADDTPYWLVSSRRPAALLGAIAAARRSRDNER